uniref:C2H2-type domain-containing protein n=1 Tax=Anopheles minimus TaxID=112268 RepID=A0A182VRZ9_9DIPT
MNSPAGREKCGICGTHSLIFHPNLMAVKTKFSSTTVFQLLERFTERELSHQVAYLEESGVCNDCLAKLNDYDAAYTKALIIQQELTDLLQNGPKWYAEVEQELDVANEEEDIRKHKGLGIKWVPHLERPGAIEGHGKKKQAFSIAGLSTVRVSMKCNVCGELFNNIHAMKLHSHDEVGEEDQLETLARESPSSAPSPTLVIETVKSEPTSSVNSDYDADEYIDYTINMLNAKDEEDEASAVDEYCTTENNAEKESNEQSEQNNEKIDVPYVCCLCEAKFESKLELKAHFKTDHPNNTEGNVCKVCGISTRTRAALASHYGKHLRESQLTCLLCNKKFTQRGSLQRHMAIHTGEKTYQCDLCGKQYLHYSSFYMHQLAHRNVRSKKCTICGYTLRSNSHLKRHMRTHSGEKPFACPVCGQKFSQRYNMVQHQKTHKGILGRSAKTFSCPSCDYISDRSALMKKHMLKHHGMECMELAESPETKETLVRNDDTKRKSPLGNMFVQSMFDMTLITINFCQICYILKVGPGLGWLYYFLLGLFGVSLILLFMHGLMGLCGRLRCSKPLPTSCFNCLYNASMFMVVVVYMVNLVGSVLMLKEAENKCQLMLEHTKSIMTPVLETP